MGITVSVENGLQRWAGYWTIILPTLDMALMVLQGVQVYQDVIQITYHAYIHQISEYLIDEPLEGCWCVGESEWHYSPFI